MSKREQGTSYWEIIKEVFIDFFKSETNSTAGKVNLLLGLFVFVLVLACLTSNVFQMIFKYFYPNNSIGMPWYGKLMALALGIFYFYFCANKLMEIEKIQQQFKIKQKPESA